MTALPTEPAPPLVRRVPVRSWEPPYDDELPPRPVVEGSLALSHPAFGPPRAATPLHVVPRTDGPDVPDVQHAGLPDPKAWTRRLAQALVEAFAGQRPAAQLEPWTAPDVYGMVQRRIGRAAATSRRPVVCSVHVSAPAEAIVEACAVIDTGDRRRALALRLEGVDGRWCCTALQVC